MAITSEPVLQVLYNNANISLLSPNKSLISPSHKKYTRISTFCYESNDRFTSLSCKCRKSETETVSDAVSEKRNDRFVNGDLSSNGNGVFSSKLEIGGVSSLEEEAWELLRASMVYYYENPVGTIAANDPSDSSILNYDQVFIRDFIPSGIAFLLKGEYDIVRNFILHTLQLQVICYSYMIFFARF